MNLIPFFIAALLFILMLLTGFFAFDYLRKMKARRQLIVKIKEEGTENSRAEVNQNEMGTGLKGKILKFATYLGVLAKPKNKKELSKMKLALIRAGYRSENSLMMFFGIKTALGIFCAILVFSSRFFILKNIPAAYFLFFIIIAGISGFYFPNIFVHYKTMARKNKILENFPDALDLIIVCVEAGMGLDAAINRVGDEIKLSNKILSDEFRLLSLELRAGKMRKDALKNLALRTDLEDVNSLVTLLIQTEKFGTKVGQALRVYSDSMRTKRYQRAEEIASKLPIKLVFPLVIFIFPSLFITILGPALIQLFRNLNG